MTQDNKKIHLPPGTFMPAAKAFPYMMALRFGPSDAEQAMLTFHADGTISGDVSQVQRFLENATVDIPAPMLLQLWMIRAMMPSVEPTPATTPPAPPHNLNS